MSAEHVRRCARWACPLSRYNSDSVCSACSRTQEPVPSPNLRLPDSVWLDETMRSALAGWDFGAAGRG